MSNPGERDDALESEVVDEAEIDEGLDTADTDEGGDDEGDGDSGEGDEHLAEGDHEQEGARERGTELQVEGAQPKISRASLAVMEAKKAAKAAKEEAETARREAAQLRAEAQGRQTREQAELEAQRLSLMPPEEKYDYLLKQQETKFEARFGALQFQQADSGDRVAFESLCSRGTDQGKALAAVRDEVERRLGELRRNGGNTSREVLAKYILGERAYDRAGRVKAKAEKRGAANIQRQQGKPTGGSGSVASEGRRSGGTDRDARAKRLENIDL